MFQRRVTTLVVTMVILILATFGTALSPFPTARASLAWNPPVIAEQYRGNNLLSSALQSQNGTIWLAWQSDRSGNTSIYFKTLTPGRGWDFTTNLTTKASNSGPNLLQLANTTILVFWAGNQTGHYNIYYRSFNDIGHKQSWGTIIPVTSTTTGDDSLPSTSLARDGTVWLVWTRQIGASDQLYYKTLRNNVWSGELQLTTDSNLNFASSVVIGVDGVVRVVWGKEPVGASSQIYYKTFNGTTWSSETLIITTTPSGGDDLHPSIIQSRDGNFWVFWTRVTVVGSVDDYKIFGKYSADNGQTWPVSTESQLTFNPSGRTDIDEYPAAVQSTSDNTLWIFYSTNYSNKGEFDIYGIQSSPITGVHHVTVSSIKPSNNWTYPGGLPSAGVNSIVTLYVTVADPGDYLESVTISVNVWNGSAVYPLKTVTGSVVSGGSIQISFVWNTTGAVAARYALTARVPPVPGTSPGNMGDSSLTLASRLWVMPLGDVNQDGNVDANDVSVAIFDYGATPGSSRWNPYVDLKNSGFIDASDISYIIYHYGTFT